MLLLELHALQSTSTGDDNIAIGYRAGKDTNNSANIYIGNLVSGSATGTFEYVIGNANHAYDTSQSVEGAGTETRDR